MTKIFTSNPLRLFYLLFLVGIFKPGQGSAQKKAIAYLVNPVVNINLMLPSADSLLLVDGTGALYANRFSASVDENDADKLSNFYENICLFRNRHNLAIETRPIPKDADTLFIRLWGMRQPTYTLQVKLRGVSLLLPVHGWLVDNYLHTQVPVNLFGKTEYSFKPGTDTSSYLNRFMIVFTRNDKQDENAITTSGTAQLNTGNITVYPNPVAGSKLTLQFNSMPRDIYTISMSNLSGRVLSAISIMHSGGNNQYYLSLNSVYIKGIYAITISGKNTQKIIHLPVIINQ